jgi:hypothetical protein
MTQAVDEVQYISISGAPSPSQFATYTWPTLVTEVDNQDISPTTIKIALQPAVAGTDLRVPPTTWYDGVVSYPAINQQSVELLVNSTRYPNPGPYYVWVWIDDVGPESFPVRGAKVILI